jgi:hypothetical protein
MALNQIVVGERNVADGATIDARGGKQGEQLASDLHGRFYEQAYRGNLFTAGMITTSISNVTFTVATTGATATPIIGLYNPSGSGVNAVLLQATLAATITAVGAATGCGGFTWMASALAGPISTGIIPFRTNGLTANGSACKAMAGTALTGLTGTLALLRGSSLGGGSVVNASFTATAVAMQTVHIGSAENLDGSIIVPPNAVIGLFANTTPVAHSATSGLLWEEVPV